MSDFFSGTPEHLALYEAMSVVSEAVYHATWMDDTAVVLWRTVVTGVCSWPDVQEAQIAHLRSLSAALNGWVDYDGTIGQCRFYPLAEWLAKYETSQ